MRRKYPVLRRVFMINPMFYYYHSDQFDIDDANRIIETITEEELMSLLWDCPWLISEIRYKLNNHHILHAYTSFGLYASTDIMATEANLPFYSMPVQFGLNNHMINRTTKEIGLYNIRSSLGSKIVYDLSCVICNTMADENDSTVWITKIFIWDKIKSTYHINFQAAPAEILEVFRWFPDFHIGFERIPKELEDICNPLWTSVSPATSLKILPADINFRYS